MSVRLAPDFHLNAVSLESNLASALGQHSKERNRPIVILQKPEAHEKADKSVCVCVCEEV